MVVPQLRFKEFSGNWGIKYLGDSFTLVSGFAFPSSASVDNGAKWLKIADVGIQEMRPNNLSYLPLDYLDKYRQFIVNDNDYVIALTRPILNKKLKISKVGKFYDGALLNQRVAKIHTKENDLDFIYSLLQKSKTVEELDNSIAGTDPPNLSLNDVKEIKLAFPSKQEQTKIASFLSAVDEKISQLTQKHALLSQYKQGMMQKLFSQQIRFKADDGSAFGEWEDLKICDLVRSLDAGVSVNSEDIKPTNDEYSVLKTSCISSGYFDENERKRVLLEEEINRLKEPVLDNSILMSRMNTPLLVGMNAYIEKAPKNTYLPDRLWQLKINADKVLTRWLAFYLGSENGLSQIRDLASGTSNSMKNIKKSDVLNLEIFVPSKEEQTKIANFLSAVDQKIEVVAQQIEQAKTWKKGLLQQMFV